MLVCLRLLGLCAGLCIWAVAGATPELLHPPVRIEHRIELKKTQQFFFDLPAGAFFQTLVKTSSTTLELRLFDSESRQIVGAPTRLLAIVPTAGRYRLDVSCAPNAMAGGSYLLEVAVNRESRRGGARSHPGRGTSAAGAVGKGSFQGGCPEELRRGSGGLSVFRRWTRPARNIGVRWPRWPVTRAITTRPTLISSARSLPPGQTATASPETHAFYLWGAMYVDRDRQHALHLFEQSLAAARQIDNPAWRAIVLNATAAMYMPAEIDRARKLLEEAKEDAARAGSAQLRADVLLAEGNSFTYREDFRRSLDSYEEALSLYRSAGYRFGIANALDNAGNSFMEIGDWDGALKALNESIALWAKEGNRIQEGFALHNQGSRVCRARKDWSERAANFSALTSRFQELGATEAEGVNYTELGETYVASGQPHQALECFEHAIQALNKGGTLQERGRALLLRSRARRSLARFEEAAADAGEALRLFRELSDRNSELLACEALARAEFSLRTKC